MSIFAKVPWWFRIQEIPPDRPGRISPGRKYANLFSFAGGKIRPTCSDYCWLVRSGLASLLDQEMRNHCHHHFHPLLPGIMWPGKNVHNDKKRGQGR